MTRYINTKYNNEVETIDSLNSDDFSTLKEFRLELKRLVFEYTTAYCQHCYSSIRSTRAYK
jgi:hypothetical protein